MGRDTAIFTEQGHISELARVLVQPEGIKHIAGMIHCDFLKLTILVTLFHAVTHKLSFLTDPV